eukprot:gene2336-8632_t
MLTQRTLGSYPRGSASSAFVPARVKPATCRLLQTPFRLPFVARATSGLFHPGEESQDGTDDMGKDNFGGYSGSFLSVPEMSLGRSFVPSIQNGATGGEAEREDMGSGGSLSSVLSPKRLNFLKGLIPESFDKLAIACVFAEWMRTMTDLPLILRRSVEMGLFSSAQLVRFFSMDVRPSMVRSVSRSLPPTWARDFVGRLMADPAFVQKMVLESSFAAVLSLVYEARARGENFTKELDLALINTLGMAVATGATTWLVAPSRSYGAVHKFPWQQALEGLPNNVFDASGPLRHYTLQARAGGFLSKMAELSAVGAITGTATSLMSQGAVAFRQRADPTWQPSVAIPAVAQSSAGLAAYFAINANTRFQLLGGLDRFLMERSKSIVSYLGISAVARALSQGVGELSRPWWQGLPKPEPAKPKTIRRRVARKVSKRVPRSQIPAPAPPSEEPLVAAATTLAVSAAAQGSPAAPAMEPTTTAAAAASPAVDFSAAPSTSAQAQVSFPEPAAVDSMASSRAAPAAAATSAPSAENDFEAMFMQQMMMGGEEEEPVEEKKTSRKLMRGGGGAGRSSRS